MREWLLMIAVSVGAATITVAFFPPLDYLEYYAAGRLNVSPTSDPYDAEQLLELQRTIEPERPGAVLMWNPPWVLPIVTPFALLPFTLGRFLWLTLQTFTLLVAGRWAWTVYQGERARWWLPLVLGMTFGPTMHLLGAGQISALLLLGFIGFLWCLSRDRPFTAGVFGALSAIKPHLFPLFALALLFEGLRTRRGAKVLLGGLGTLFALALIEGLLHPQIMSQYLDAFDRPRGHANTRVQDWLLPTLGSWLRRAWPGTPFWVQFAPAIVAVVAFVPYYVMRVWRRAWDWNLELPWLVIVCMFSACYGAWPFDLVVLLLPLWHATARLQRGHEWTRRTVFICVIGYACLSFLSTSPGVPIRCHVWVTPVMGIVYGWVRYAGQMPRSP